MCIFFWVEENEPNEEKNNFIQHTKQNGDSLCKEWFAIKGENQCVDGRMERKRNIVA